MSSKFKGSSNMCSVGEGVMGEGLCAGRGQEFTFAAVLQFFYPSRPSEQKDVLSTYKMRTFSGRVRPPKYGLRPS